MSNLPSTEEMLNLLEQQDQKIQMLESENSKQEKQIQELLNLNESKKSKQLENKLKQSELEQAELKTKWSNAEARATKWNDSYEKVQKQLKDQRSTEDALESVTAVYKQLDSKYKKMRMRFIIALIAVFILSGALTFTLFHKIAPKGSETSIEQFSTEQPTETQIEEQEPLQEVTEPPQAELPEVQTQNLTVNSDSVNVRTAPNEESEILGQVNTNDIVIAVGEPQNGWQEVSWNNQQTYIHEQYLTYPEPPTEEKKSGEFKIWLIVGGVVAVFMLYCFTHRK